MHPMFFNTNYEHSINPENDSAQLFRQNTVMSLKTYNVCICEMDEPYLIDEANAS